jgi:hypothetical protein
MKIAVIIITHSFFLCYEAGPVGQSRRQSATMSSWFGRRQEARSPERVFWHSAPHAVRLAAWVRARAMVLAARADTGVFTAGGVGGFPERHTDSGYALVFLANSRFPPPALAHPPAAQRAQQRTF